MYPAELRRRIAGAENVLPASHRPVRPQQDPVYLYGYSFAINSAKTVESITLPNNRNVVVLAVDVSPAAGGPAPAASPTLSPHPASYTSTQTVTLSDSTPGAVIYYTINGTTPTTSSAQFSPGTPLQISATTTIEAIAVASGYSNSAVSSGTYITATTPTMTPAPGTYTSTQSVTLSDTTAGAAIYYTLNGTTPTTVLPGTIRVRRCRSVPIPPSKPSQSRVVQQ